MAEKEEGRAYIRKCIIEQITTSNKGKWGERLKIQSKCLFFAVRPS